MWWSLGTTDAVVGSWRAKTRGTRLPIRVVGRYFVMNETSAPLRIRALHAFEVVAAMDASKSVEDDSDSTSSTVRDDGAAGRARTAPVGDAA
jgi:hypothetical protein